MGESKENVGRLTPFCTLRASLCPLLQQPDEGQWRWRCGEWAAGGRVAMQEDGIRGELASTMGKTGGRRAGDSSRGQGCCGGRSSALYRATRRLPERERKKKEPSIRTRAAILAAFAGAHFAWAGQCFLGYARPHPGPPCVWRPPDAALNKIRWMLSRGLFPCLASAPNARADVADKTIFPSFLGAPRR